MTMAKIDGTNGGDTLFGTSAADQINGLGGNDTLLGEPTASTAAWASTRCSTATRRSASP